MRVLRLLLLLLVAAAVTPAAAAGRTHLAVSLLAESENPAAGRTIRVALKFVPEPGWHGYWSNPGDSGLAPKVAWDAPKGVRFGPLLHPAPELLSVAGLASFVHSGTHVLLTEMRIPSGLAPGTPLPVRAKLEWLACTDRVCVPERAELALDLTVGDGRISTANRAVFAKASAALPKRAATDGLYSLDGTRLLLGLPVRLSDPARARFYPDQQGILDAAAQRAAATPDGVEIRLPALARLSAPLTGVVTDGKRSYRVRARPSSRAASLPPRKPAAADGLEPPAAAAAPETNAPASPAAVAEPALGLITEGDGAEAGFVAALLGALVGGLLLNLMPCVFPVLSLKAMSLARCGRSPALARREALAYLAGTVAVCVSLGALLLGLKAAGAEVGWSFQLQSPAVVLALILLMTAVAANLAGLFEMHGPSLAGGPPRKGAMASFSTGALSAFIATPCSAPFMASALGAALLLPPAAGLAVFAGLGIGLGLPFLAIGFVPAVRNRLPRPGPWMKTFQRILAIPMALTAVWLLWVLGRQSGADMMAAALLVALLLVAALWWIGRRQAIGRPRAWVPLAPLAALAAIALVMLPAERSGASAAPTAQSERFSVERLEQLRAAGRPVFVDFTADWCLACKVNERIAIDRAGTQAAFGEAGVVTLVGDWTRGDPEITRFLAAHDRNSIPFYLFYAPGREPRILPQVLTPGLLQRIAREAGDTSVQEIGRST
ncbi:MAG: protein-disulfide reductase DsbD family protein [Alphaproteobacteria bacterium]